MANSTNEKIRYAAFKSFLEVGYEATNIRDICKEVDIKAASLYFYYKSKQELFLSIYDSIYGDKINFIGNIEELKQDVSPEMKLYNFYKKTMEYYIKSIVNQKFLLRYHLFPPREIANSLREKYKFWTNEENRIILDILKQCLFENILDDNKQANDYLMEYKRFEKAQVIDMISSNIKMEDKDIYKRWSKFWNYEMLNEQII